MIVRFVDFGDLGQTLLQLSLCLAGLQLLAGSLYWQRLKGFLPEITGLNAITLALSMASLIAAYVNVDLSLANVAQNTNANAPLLYRITGAWGNHEGSLLLWLLWMGLYAAALAWHPAQRLAPKLTGRALAVLGALQILLTGYALILSNPFWRLPIAAKAGAGLNPLLQDIGLAIHPPVLYLGMTGLCIAFALSIAALLGNHSPAPLAATIPPTIPSDTRAQEPAWTSLARPWLLLSWGWLTLGIALGSWWAYRELGWGGWWFWDPVENAALIPWLFASALLHALNWQRQPEQSQHQTPRGGMGNQAGQGASWAPAPHLLAIFTLGSTLLAMFLVRSGLLTSVHAFALDPARGSVLLAITAVVTLASLALFAARTPVAATAPAATQSSWLSPSAWLLFGYLIFALTAVTVLLGTAYPLLHQAVIDSPMAVAGDFYQQMVVPLLLLLLGGVVGLPILMRPAPPLTPKRISRYRLPALALLVLASVLNLWIGWHWIAGGVIVALGLLAIILNWPSIWRPQRRVMALAHLAAGLAAIGMVGASLWQQSYIVKLAPGANMVVGSYHLTLQQLREIPIGQNGANYSTWQAVVAIRPAHNPTSPPILLTSEKRHYAVEDMVTSEAAINYGFWRDLYVVVGQPDIAAGTLSIKFMINPLIGWLWAAVVLATLAAWLGAIRSWQSL
ncbi:MAG: heme lyase CcmF/NrfE family subunit [Rhodospirillaceae bacterium]|jgi:cytochrome c-type biogenesis protein CcmF|nr:heme lyase CcmF/NrfE family subunit [Rhodospirillaceae bacterium]